MLVFIYCYFKENNPYVISRINKFLKGNRPVEKLDEERKELQAELKDLISSQNASQCDVGSITDYMSKWNELETTDKMAVVDSLIKVIRAGETTLEIEWKI